MNTVSVFLLTGFLGAGKTTLLKVLLSHPWEGRNALVVNEFGDIGIDGEDVQRGHAYDLVEIRSGCVCCMLQGQFVEGFRHLVTTVDPERIFVEASGVSDPAKILNALKHPQLQPRIERVAVLTVVDATFFPNREFLGTFFDKQIREADAILLNKVDQVASPGLDEIETSIECLNPSASLFRTVHCNVNPGVLLRSLTAETASRLEGDELERDERETKPVFATFSIEAQTNVSLRGLKRYLQRRGKEILRMKGSAATPDGQVALNFSSHGLDVRGTDSTIAGTRLVFVVRGGTDGEEMRKELMHILSA